MHSFSYFPLSHASPVCPGEVMFGPPSARLYDTAAVEAWASASTNAAVYVFPSSFKHKKFFVSFLIFSASVTLHTPLCFLKKHTIVTI